MSATATMGSGQRIGSSAGKIGGGIIGGIIGSLFGPVGTLVGRAVGAQVGNFVGGVAGEAVEGYLSENMEAANEEAETEEQARSGAVAAEDEDCSECEPRCRELEQQMKDEMYANKRGPGGRGKHGLNLRRAEQICGEYGPDMTKMESSVLRDGSRRFREFKPWDTHKNEIQQQQQRLRDMKEEYEKLGCKKRENRDINYNELERMTADDFNPTDNEWLGPNHPSCSGIQELIRNNRTPELPTFPRPSSGSAGNPGAPMS